jgi:hypothetical protein
MRRLSTAEKKKKNEREPSNVVRAKARENQDLESQTGWLKDSYGGRICWGGICEQRRWVVGKD